MTLEPWIIEQHEQEERRRREEDEARQSRIELPLTSPAAEGAERPAREAQDAPARVQIVPLSPGMSPEGDSTFDL